MNDITQPGGLLDTVFTFVVPGYGILRNLKAMEDPAQYGKGTLYGMATNYGQSPMSLSNVGSNLGFGGGDSWFGGQPQSPYNTSYGFGDDAGFLGTGWGAQPYGQLTTGDAYAEIGDYAGYDSPSWTSQDEQSYADEIGVSEY